MFNLSTKTTINVLKHHVKGLLEVTDTALVKKWALENGLGKLDMRRKNSWRLVLDAVFVMLHKGSERWWGNNDAIAA
ncbi:MAG: hypothetical protein PUP92_19035 [Rhizonema sp. PD38]|nr:hypothetical protein [Rhizonema sp. PD38]